MNRKRQWVIVLVFSTILLVGYSMFMFSSMGMGLVQDNNYDTEPKSFQNSNSGEEVTKSTLPIPPILEDLNPDENIAEFNLQAQAGRKVFIEGTETPTYGYNGDFLGPVIRVKRGEQVKIKVDNFLDEPTTVHWHGLEVPGDMDGGPHQDIMPGSAWYPEFSINQPAATLWYHPHLLHKTGEQVYKGLAGLFYIDDDVSERLDIPKEYGIDDIPLVIQDRRFTKDGRMVYDVGMRDLMHGYMGDTVLVNGAINPTLAVKTVKMRFRLLNGSNARTYNFHLSDGRTFYQIASDGGFLENPVDMTALILSPGERAEIIVDFSKDQVGGQLSLLSDDVQLMGFDVVEQASDGRVLPEKLTTIQKIPEAEASVVRSFQFGGMGPMVNINGKQMNMDRIDEKIDLNATEIWEISNPTMGMGMMARGGGVIHPFHAHGVQFQILERNGKTPPENERGWKDTILVASGERVRAITRFKYKGTFMYHCHILEHEDAGMMGQFLVK